MDKWSVDEVYTWLLDVVGIPEASASLFKQNEVDGHVLSSLTEEEFKNEFHTSFGQRKKIQMLRDDILSKGRYWTIWVVPLKGVKVGVRNVDPDRDIEELKTKIRDHPELNLTGYILSEFSLRRKGGEELLVGSIVKDCLAPGDEVDILSHRAEVTHKAAQPNPYGTNMYKPHYRPPPLPGSPRERSPSDPGEDVLIPSPIKNPTKREDNLPLVNSLALSFNTNANQRHSFSGASTNNGNLRSSSTRVFNTNGVPNSPPIRSAMVPTITSPSLVSLSASSPSISSDTTPTSNSNTPRPLTRQGSHLRLSTINTPSPSIPESPGITPESPFTTNALHGHAYLYNSASSLPSPGATSMASSWENITNPGSSRSSSPSSPKTASPLLLPNIPRSPSDSGRSSPSLSGSYGISHSSNEMMANAIVDYNMFMTNNNASGSVRSSSGRRWSTIATPSPPLASTDELPVAYSFKRRLSVPTPPTLPPMGRRESLLSISESSEPPSPGEVETDTDREDDFDDADGNLDQALEDDTVRPSHPFYVVGIGASAGGLEALEQFFDNMPNNSGMAFVVVQHLSPNYKSMMGQLLGKHTGMVIKKVEDRMKIEPNHIYLLQPSMNIFIEHGLLRVHKQDRSGRAVNLPINLFFKSLGLYFKEKTIGIILSGTGSDGMDGIRCIKEQSGMVMVQNNSAKFDGMPQSAINTGLVDYILSPEQMPAELLRYARFPATVGTLPSDPLISYTQTILDIVYKQTAINFSNYKKATIWRRIEHRMNVNRYDDIEVYIKYLESNHEEVTLLAKDLLIGVTKFFRDHEVWEGMKKRVIPAIVQNSKSGAVRVWVVACSTGEEAYTLAILFQEYKEQSKLDFEIKIYATDIDRDAVERAGTGYYEEGSLVASLSIERIQKFFVKRGNGYVVTPQLRRMVIFAVQNVISDPPFNKMDLITCRNLLIYFEHQQQKEVLSLFHYSLIPGGFLVLGKSESNLSSSSRFEQFDQKWRIFRNKGGFASWNAKINKKIIPPKQLRLTDIPAHKCRHLLLYNRTS